MFVKPRGYNNMRLLVLCLLTLFFHALLTVRNRFRMFRWRMS